MSQFFPEYAGYINVYGINICNQKVLHLREEEDSGEHTQEEN